MASEQMPRRVDNIKEVDVEIYVRESLDNKGRDERVCDQKEKGRELLSDRARSRNIVKDKEAEERRGERESGGAHNVGKFEVKAEQNKGSGGKAEPEGRTREVVGKVWIPEEKQRSSAIGKVEAEKARTMDKTREEAKGREKAETQGQTKVGGGEEQGRGRKEKGGENEQFGFEEISKSRAEAQHKVKERNKRAQQAATEALNSAAQTVNMKNMQANEKATKPKDVTKEKGQQGNFLAKDLTEKKGQPGYDAAKNTTGSVATAPVFAVKTGKRAEAKPSEEAKVREKDESKGQIYKVAGEEQGIGREDKGKESKQPSSEEISKYIAEAEQKAIDAIASAQERYERENHAASVAPNSAAQTVNEKNMQAHEKATQPKPVTKENGQQGNLLAKDVTEKKGRQGYDAAKNNTGNVATASAAVETGKRAEAKPREEAKAREKAESRGQINKGASEEQGRGREDKGEENKQLSLEEISKYRAEAQQKAFDAIASAQERYEREKQAASEASNNATQTAKEQAKDKATQAKDVTRERDQQGNFSAKDVTENKDHDASKDTTGSVAKSAVDYIAPVAEKTKSVGDTTAHFIGDKASQAKDATVEIGKSAAKVAADWKDKATVAGWSAAHYSAEMTVEGTKAVTNAVTGVAEYAGQNTSDLAAKSVDTAKGFAAAAGENAKEYTGRKKVEAERDLEAKRAAQNQERPAVETTSESFQSGQGQQEQDQEGKWEPGAIGQTVGQVPQRTTKPHESLHQSGQVESQETQALQGKANESIKSIGETLGSVAQRVKKPLDKATQGGSAVLEAVGETVVEIGENMMKPAQKVQQHGDEGKGGGVLNAIGETIAEIAETTTAIVAGEDETVSRERIVSESGSHEYDRGKQGGLKLD